VTRQEKAGAFLQERGKGEKGNLFFTGGGERGEKYATF